MSLIVMILFFGFGTMFAYGVLFESTEAVSYRGVDLGFSLEPSIWKALFLIGSIGMFAPGVFILLGLMRGGKLHVRIDANNITLAGRPMARDVTIRWDDIVSVKRYRIQGFPAIALKSRTGNSINLSEHIFPLKGEFETLCREIEARASSRGLSA
jgi:hypothetical protein